ncbi:molybdenum cofactor biosynthesis protein MoaE [Chloroflexota bacterium]
MVQITDQPLNPGSVINSVKTDDSGCVSAYIGLIRDNSNGKPVQSVEYSDEDGAAVEGLRIIESEIWQKWPVNSMAIVHRVGLLEVGEINLVVAIAACHRGEAFAACQYAVDRFKELMPAPKAETYTDGSIATW